MLLCEDVLLPVDPGSILRLLEQRSDGSLLYSCVSSNSSIRSIEVRLFHPETLEDTLIYVHSGGSDIVNASLNPDCNVIAFTTFEARKKRSNVTESSSSSKSLSGERVKQSQCAGSEKIDRWAFAVPGRSQQTHKGGMDDDPGHVKSPAAAGMDMSNKLVRGKYVSFLADINPTNWVRKFSMERKYYQRVVFTAISVIRNADGQQLLVNKLLLVMHRKSIGSYDILLKPVSVDEPETKKEEFVAKLGKVQMHGILNCVTIVSRAFWSQWDPVLQRLYFLIVTKKKQRSDDKTTPYFTYSTSLCCEQFGEHQVHQQMFVCPLQLGLGDEVLSYKTSEYVIWDLDPTVSDPHMNMRMLQLSDGTMCLCWQVIKSYPTEKLASYQVAILTRDISLLCNNAAACTESERCSIPISFCGFNDNIIVSCPGRWIHVLAVGAISNSTDGFVQQCHYLSKHNPLTGSTNVARLPYNIPWVNERSPSTVSYRYYAYDCSCKKIVSISLCTDGIRSAFSNKLTTVSNKIAITRFAFVTFANTSSYFPSLQKVICNFMGKDMQMSGAQILASVLIHSAANDVCAQYRIEPRLRYLLPVASPVSPRFQHEFNFTIHRVCCIKQLSEQVSRTMDQKAAESWNKVFAALESSCLEPYCLNRISEELEMLHKTSDENHLREQRKLLRARLSEVYESEILCASDSCDFEDEEENILNCFSSSEPDDSCENSMALTYERLRDHLEQFIQEKGLARCFARSYVISQLRVVNHVIVLFLLVAKVEDYDQSLFVPVQSEERSLLQLLNQLLAACVATNFPLPRGFQTFLSCLTFRCCLTTHCMSLIDEFDVSGGASSCSALSDAVSISHSAEDIDELAYEFFQLVDSSCIQLTGEFIARLLEELPNHECFGSFVHQMLKRVEVTHHSIPEGVLQLWKHPLATSRLAAMQAEKLDELHRQPQHQEGSKHRNLRSPSSGKAPSNFPPLDLFLRHVRHRAAKCNADVNYIEDATLQNTITKYGRDSLHRIAF